MRTSPVALFVAAIFSLAVGCTGASVVGGPDDTDASAQVDVTTSTDATDVAPPEDTPPLDTPAMDVVDIDAPDAGDDVTAPDDLPDASDDVTDADVPVDLGPGGCASDADCATDPAGRVCDRVRARCVECLPSADACPASQHCDEATYTCVAGCRSDEGCASATADGGVATRVCDTDAHACVECTVDTQCAGGRLCRGNQCVFVCGDMGCGNDATCCLGGCVDTRTNAGHCGACGNACVTPNAAPACVNGACAVGACSEGYGDCDGAHENGCELDTRSDTANCGGCGRACAGADNAIATCAAGVCGFSCLPGHGDCDGDPANGCEVDLTTDVTRCGSCTNACPAPANGTAACAGGACVIGMCATGFGDCDRDPSTGCETNTDTAVSHCGACGAACSPGLTCEGGRCVVPCPDGFVRCGGVCAQLSYDPSNCGACGNRCATGAVCSAGRCVSTCGPGQVTCAGGCTDTQTDAQNCGACGNRCPAGYACRAGACEVACVAGQTVCAMACVDTSTSTLHCGVCGNACAAGEQCMTGRCTLTCRPPQVVCGNECAELSRDPNHCGACNNVCPTGCFDGACARVDQLEAGTFNNCARFTSGRVFCWGRHSSNSTFTNGMLTAAGDAYGHRPTPVQVLVPEGTPLEGVEQVVMGSNRACARLTDGAVRCWAAGVAMGTVFGLPAVRQLSARETNFCGLGADGQVYCWDGLPRAVTAPALAPAVTLGAPALEVLAGASFTCARLGDGTVRCWGTGTSGQLGNGASVTSATPVTVQGLSDAVELTAGQHYACARRAGGTVVCWGRNVEGQLGNGTTSSRNAPVTVSGIAGARVVRAGMRHTCAIVADGSVRCWGEGVWSQLGDGGTTNRTTPVAVAGLSGEQLRIALYDHHTCAVGVDRRVRCWGYNPYGEAGGGTELVATPRAVQFEGADLRNVTDLQVGRGVNGALMATTQWRCALRNDGRVICWGARANGNEAGQLGRGNTTQSPLPAYVTGITDATAIAVGWQHACALRAGGTVVCWGSNAQGQLGDGTNTNRTTPVAVPGLAGVAEIHAGDYTTCARLTTGAMRCWGYNFYGGVGNGEMLNTNAPVPVMGVSNATQFSMGSDSHCARLADSTAVCWGRNLEGELGDGFRTNRSVPFPVQTPTSTASAPASQMGIIDVESNYFRAYAHVMGASSIAWGWGVSVRPVVRAAFDGVVYNTRVQVLGESVVDTECEIRTDGNTYCRGRNEFGQVGTGAASFTVSAWTALPNRMSRVRLGRGYGTPCGVEASTGRVLCWGWAGENALLATGVTGITAAPAEVPMP
ncbi:MAG: MXAN_6577-like cysteine-rich protein [Polyangiales bacterium]